MLYPSIDKLLNIVSSKYILVQAAALRSKEMLEKKYFQLKENKYKSIKTLGRALEEIEAGLINIKREGAK